MVMKMRKKVGGELINLLPGDLIVCEPKPSAIAMSIRRGGKLFFEDTDKTEQIVSSYELQDVIKKICAENSFSARMVKDDKFEKIWVLQEGGESVNNEIVTGMICKDLNSDDCSWITGIIKKGTKVYLYFGDGGDGTKNGRARISLKPNLPTVYDVYPALIEWH